MEQAIEELLGREFVAWIQRAFQQQFQYGQVITDTDIFTISDGRSFVIAHTGGTYYLITGHVKTLAALLHVVRQMGEFKCLIIHNNLFN